MNDIDRSVDSFDMALRRRFFWKHYECNYDVVAEKYKDESDLESYSSNCRNLNQHIVSEDGFNLGESYQLGHSYFLNPKKLNSQHIKKAWDNNIAPLLKEYLRSEYKENDIKKHLDVAKNIFLGKLSA
jgi:5-methylcytosine-specific restriction protein B